jgi:hypothetical protein
VRLPRIVVPTSPLPAHPTWIEWAIVVPIVAAAVAFIIYTAPDDQPAELDPAATILVNHLAPGEKPWCPAHYVTGTVKPDGTYVCWRRAE